MKNISLSLNDYEYGLLLALEEKRGIDSDMAFRIGLRTLYRKEFPTYGEKRKKEDAKEICLARGGEIILEDNLMRCRIVNNGVETLYAL